MQFIPNFQEVSDGIPDRISRRQGVGQPVGQQSRGLQQSKLTMYPRIRIAAYCVRHFRIERWRDRQLQLLG